jgi:hypothetical protein
VRRKFGNIKAEAFGKLFDSRLERDRFLVLKSRADAGTIANLETQVKIPLKVNGFLVCHYIADAVYSTPTGTVVEDCKGVQTDVFRLKHKLFQAIHGHKINIVTKATINS